MGVERVSNPESQILLWMTPAPTWKHVSVAVKSSRPQAEARLTAFSSGPDVWLEGSSPLAVWLIPLRLFLGYFLTSDKTKQKKYPNFTTLQKGEVKMNNAGFIPQVCFATFSPKLFQNLKKSSKYQKCKLESKQQWPKKHLIVLVTLTWKFQKTWCKRNEDRCCELGYTVAFVYQIQPGFHTRICGVKQVNKNPFVFRAFCI